MQASQLPVDMAALARRDPELAGLVARLCVIEDEFRSLQALVRARKFNPDQLRVPAGSPGGGQWSGGSDGDAGGGGGDASIYQALFDPRRAVVQRSIEAALAVFAGLSGSNGSSGQAFIAFNAREFRTGEGGDGATALVGQLTREDVDRYCPRFGDVQARTDETYARVASERPFASASQVGTAVHTSLKRQIDSLGDENYRAEVSVIKSKQEAENIIYGAANSIRIDALERVDRETACVYDVKTGRAGLAPSRMTEIASNAAKVYPGVTRLIVTEVRPGR